MSDLKTNLEAILQEKQDKIIPANIKKDVQIFDVIGTYTGNSGTDYEVKLFETEEEMQADENAQEGDLAVVYRSEIQNMTANIQTQYITFPETVTLPEAVTSDYYCMLRATDPSKMFDGNILLSKTSFRFDGYPESGMIRVRYSSSDGITYTRTRFEGDSGDLSNPVDLGTIVGVYSSEEWNDTMGYFMQIGGNVFEGLFECNNIPNPDIVSAYKFYKYIEENGERVPDKEDTEFTKEEVTLFKESMENSNFDSSTAVLIKNLDTEEYYVVSSNAAILLTSEKAYICGIPPRDDEESVDFINILYKIDTDTKTLEQLNTVSSITAIQGDDCWFGCPLPNMNKIQISKVGYPDFEESDVRYYANNNQYVNIDLPPRTNILKYEFVSSQLTTTKDLVYNSIYYGKDGVNEGTLTQNVSNSFADINAEIYGKVQQAYDNMEPRVLTDNDKTIDKNIYFIPTKSDGTSLLDTSNVTNMESLFMYCENLTAISLLDTSNVTDMSQMFYGCSSLINIPQLDTSNVTDMYYMFKDCSNLTVIPQLNTHNVTNMQNVFTNCSNLATIPELDISSVTNMDYAFIHCDNISNDSLNNILASLLTATSYTKTKTLNIIGLSEEQAQICTTLSNYQAFIEAGWTTGY